MISYYFEFNWVLLKVASGHFEMNAVKSFFESDWEPFLSQLTYTMGFKSDAVQLIAKNARIISRLGKWCYYFILGQ